MDCNLNENVYIHKYTHYILWSLAEKKSIVLIAMYFNRGVFIS